MFGAVGLPQRLGHVFGEIHDWTQVKIARKVETDMGSRKGVHLAPGL